jgi:hypothetical protein
MLINWSPVLIVPLLLLVIPLAIALGQVVRGGPVTVMSVGAGLSMGSFWLTLRSLYVPPYDAQTALWLIFSALVGAILLVGAWALALAQAFHARQWVMVALLCLVVYLAIAALVFFEYSGYATCIFDPVAFCSLMNASILPLILPLTLAASFLAPVVLLVYALSAGARRQPHALPDGLTISRLTAEER